MGEAAVIRTPRLGIEKIWRVILSLCTAGGFTIWQARLKLQRTGMNTLLS